MLRALLGPGHYVRELQATRGQVHEIVNLGKRNPIDILLSDYIEGTKR